MKYVALFMVLLVLCTAALGVYVYVNTKLEVVSVTLKAEEGEKHKDDFERLQQQMEAGALTCTPFTDALPGNAEDYSFFTYTFRLKNNGLIDAEMVEIQPVPVNGDVLSYATLDPEQMNAGIDVDHGRQRDTWCVVLTGRQNQEQHIVSRSFRITYYIWGIPMSQTVTYK